MSGKSCTLPKQAEPQVIPMRRNVNPLPFEIYLDNGMTLAYRWMITVDD